MSAPTIERPALTGPQIPTDEVQSRAFWAGMVIRLAEGPVKTLSLKIFKEWVRPAAPVDVQGTDPDDDYSLYEFTDAATLAGLDWADVIFDACGLSPSALTESEKADWFGCLEIAKHLETILRRKPDVATPEFGDGAATIKLTGAEVLKLLRYARAGGLR